MKWKLQLKPEIHYMIFALISPPISQSEQVDASWGKSEPVCRLKLTDSTQKKSRSVLWSQSPIFLASDFDSIQSEDIKHVWYFQPILENMFSFVMRLLATRRMFLHEFVVIGTSLQSGSVWSSVA